MLQMILGYCIYIYIYTYYTHAMLRLMSFRQSSLSVAMT